MADRREDEIVDDDSPKERDEIGNASNITRQEQEEEAMAALMTDIAFREDAESASATEIQEVVMQTLHHIEVSVLVTDNALR